MDEVRDPPVEPKRRATDTWVAPFSAFWNWIDNRDIDKHVASVFIMVGTYRLTVWAMHFAAEPHPGLGGTDIAAIIAAVTAPYMALQAAAISFYFKSRAG